MPTDSSLKTWVYSLKHSSLCSSAIFQLLIALISYSRSTTFTDSVYSGEELTLVSTPSSEEEKTQFERSEPLPLTP